MADVRVVTGAASGMGLATARRFSTFDDRLVVVDLDEERTSQVAAELRATPFPCDVSDATRVAELAALVASMGRFRALAHAAGISPVMADPLRIFDVDLRGTALLLDAFDPQVTAGSVAVCFASIAASMLAGSGDPTLDAVLDEPLAPGFLEHLAESGGPAVEDGALAYGWAKRGVQRLVRRTAISWGRRGGRVVSLSPGVIDTPMLAKEAAEQPMVADLLEHTPLGREGTAEELAAVVEFLCSDEASYLTGVDVTVDGGVTAALERPA